MGGRRTTDSDSMMLPPENHEQKKISFAPACARFSQSWVQLASKQIWHPILTPQSSRIVKGDKLALPLFIGMGIKNLSMNPVKITDICRLIKKIDSNLVYHLAVSVLASRTAVSVTRKLQSFMTALEKK